MRDPEEGLSPEGLIVTGARRDRVAPAFEPVLAFVLGRVAPDVPVYVYGSVATGAAEVGRSDVDLLAVGLAATDAASTARAATDRFADVCRGVELVVAGADDLGGDSDESYGNRAFLRHYCVHLGGPDPAADLPDVAGDARAARGSTATSAGTWSGGGQKRELVRPASSAARSPARHCSPSPAR